MHNQLRERRPRPGSRSNRCGASGNLLEVPPATVVGVKILVGLAAVGNPKRERVPLDPVAHPQGDVAQQVRLGKRAGVSEVTGSLFPALDRASPVYVDILA